MPVLARVITVDILVTAIPDVEIKRGMGYSKGKATRGGICDGEQEAVICRQFAKDNSGEI
jgi:hypothetical protein